MARRSRTATALSPGSLRELAWLDRPTMAEAGPIFRRALNELGQFSGTIEEQPLHFRDRSCAPNSRWRHLRHRWLSRDDDDPRPWPSRRRPRSRSVRRCGLRDGGAAGRSGPRSLERGSAARSGCQDCAGGGALSRYDRERLSSVDPPCDNHGPTLSGLIESIVSGGAPCPSRDCDHADPIPARHLCEPALLRDNSSSPPTTRTPSCASTGSDETIRNDHVLPLAAPATEPDLSAVRSPKPANENGDRAAPIARRQRLGGLLSYYYRGAA